MGFGGSNSTVRDDDGDDTSSGVGITAFGIAMLSLIALVFVAAVLQHGVRMCTSHAAQHGGSFRPSPEAGGRASREGLGPRAEEWENNTAYTSLSNQSDVTEGHIKLEQGRGDDSEEIRDAGPVMAPLSAGLNADERSVRSGTSGRTGGGASWVDSSVSAQSTISDLTPGSFGSIGVVTQLSAENKKPSSSLTPPPVWVKDVPGVRSSEARNRVQASDGGKNIAEFYAAMRSQGAHRSGRVPVNLMHVEMSGDGSHGNNMIRGGQRSRNKDTKINTNASSSGSSSNGPGGGGGGDDDGSRSGQLVFEMTSSSSSSGNGGRDGKAGGGDFSSPGGLSRSLSIGQDAFGHFFNEDQSQDQAPRDGANVTDVNSLNSQLSPLSAGYLTQGNETTVYANRPLSEDSKLIASKQSSSSSSTTDLSQQSPYSDLVTVRNSSIVIARARAEAGMPAQWASDRRLRDTGGSI